MPESIVEFLRSRRTIVFTDNAAGVSCELGVEDDHAGTVIFGETRAYQEETMIHLVRIELLVEAYGASLHAGELTSPNLETNLIKVLRGHPEWTPDLS